MRWEEGEVKRANEKGARAGQADRVVHAGLEGKSRIHFRKEAVEFKYRRAISYEPATKSNV